MAVSTNHNLGGHVILLRLYLIDTVRKIIGGFRVIAPFKEPSIKTGSSVAWQKWPFLVHFPKISWPGTLEEACVADWHSKSATSTGSGKKQWPNIIIMQDRKLEGNNWGLHRQLTTKGILTWKVHWFCKPSMVERVKMSIKAPCYCMSTCTHQVQANVHATCQSWRFYECIHHYHVTHSYNLNSYLFIAIWYLFVLCIVLTLCCFLNSRINKLKK